MLLELIRPSYLDKAEWREDELSLVRVLREEAARPAPVVGHGLHTAHPPHRCTSSHPLRNCLASWAYQIPGMPTHNLHLTRAPCSQVIKLAVWASMVCAGEWQACLMAAPMLMQPTLTSKPVQHFLPPLPCCAAAPPSDAVLVSPRSAALL